MKIYEKTDWIRCPECGGKTRTQVREHTVMEDFPLFCPKCRHSCVITFRGGKIEEMVVLPSASHPEAEKQK